MRRSGTGIIRTFKGDASICLVGIQRHGMDGAVVLPCNPEVVSRLLKEYGVYDEATQFTSMEGIIGLSCSWKEHGLSMWEDIQVMVN